MRAAWSLSHCQELEHFPHIIDLVKCPETRERSFGARGRYAAAAHPAELVLDLRVCHRVLRMPPGIADISHLTSASRGDGLNPARNQIWILLGEFGIFPNSDSLHQRAQTRIANAFLRKSRGFYLTVHQRRCDNVGKAMIRRLARGGVPFLRFTTDAIPCHPVGLDRYGFNRVDLYFVMKLQSGPDRGLGMVLRWIVLEVCEPDTK